MTKFSFTSVWLSVPWWGSRIFHASPLVEPFPVSFRLRGYSLLLGSYRNHKVSHSSSKSVLSHQRALNTERFSSTCKKEEDMMKNKGDLRALAIRLKVSFKYYWQVPSIFSVFWNRWSNWPLCLYFTSFSTYCLCSFIYFCFPRFFFTSCSFIWEFYDIIFSSFSMNYA